MRQLLLLREFEKNCPCIWFGVEEGAENAEEFVEEKLEDTIPDVVEAVCSKSYEFMAKDDNVRDELAKSIEEAPYAKLDRSMQHKDC